jgi:hypothetical protein
MEDISIYLRPFVYFTAIWYLWSFGIYFIVLVCSTKKNLATQLYLRQFACTEKHNKHNTTGFGKPPRDGKAK